MATGHRWRAHLRNFARLQLGLFLFGLAVALMLEARIGLDPWSALHDVLSQRSGLSFGRISQGVGLTLIAFSYTVLKVRPGVATVLNMLIIGPWVDVLRPLSWFPRADGLGVGIIQFLGGILVLGLASAVYLGARWGAGPRDGLVMGLSQQYSRSLRASRIGVEVTVLAAAALLGGSIGLGTVLFALLMGPTMQASLRILNVSNDPSPAPSRGSAGLRRSLESETTGARSGPGD